MLRRLFTKGNAVTDYSRMNYEELRKIADNDSIADKMSEEEYESLSVELWKKFRLEKIVTEDYVVSHPSLSTGQESVSQEQAEWQLGRGVRTS
jgi:hypothetical protein